MEGNGSSGERAPTTENQAVAQVSQADSKKRKRMLLSREASRKYQRKQREQAIEIGIETKALEAYTETTALRIKNCNYQISLLRARRSSVQQNFYYHNSECIFEAAQYEELRKENENLKMLNEYQQQFQFKTQA
ncbi:hypothetical protein Q3G72_025745 [Acer saccharum]|nr:hypothetical protein Q3G72_025745 [Acer saccharum]